MKTSDYYIDFFWGFARQHSPHQKWRLQLKISSVNMTKSAGFIFNKWTLNGNSVQRLKYCRMHSMFTKINSFLVPLRSAQIIYCHKVTAFTIFIKWLRAPKAYLQGTRTGDNLYYQNETQSLDIANISPRRECITVIGLESNTWFHFQLGATTSIGERNKSENISCKTKLSDRRKSSFSGATVNIYREIYTYI